MSDGLTKAFIACGWIATGIACVGNLLVATRTGGLNFPNLIITLGFFGIAYAIYRRSRVAALTMLVIFAVMRIRFYGLAASLAPNSFDVVFLDPPFGDKSMLDRALELAAPLVSADGALYIESGDFVDAARIPALNGWSVTREGRAGAVHYHLLRRENEE